MPEKKKSRAFTNGMRCYIVGKRSIGNELIATYLKRIIGNDCFVLEDIHNIPKGKSKNNSRRKLIFWDCRTKDLNNLFVELKIYNTLNPLENHIILFNVSNSMAVNKKFVMEGIRGCFYEHDSLDHFVKGVETVMEGKLWLSREMMTRYIFEESYTSSKSTAVDLTERQTEILALIAVGATNEEIAGTLCISHYTVKTHIYKIFKKINVPNRVQASLWAAKNL
jgi:LuxR family transcriptional regulator, positive regulator of biofilm formation